MTLVAIVYYIIVMVIMIAIVLLVCRDMQQLDNNRSWPGPSDFDHNDRDRLRQREIDRLQAKIRRLEDKINQMWQAEHVAEVYSCSVYPNSEGEYVSEVTSKERLSVGAELYIHPPRGGIINKSCDFPL